MEVLIIEVTGDQTYSFEPSQSAISLGRDEHNDIVLKDGETSRRHARILKQPTGYIVVDLQSTNGTFVNGRRISQQLLKPRDRIRVGKTELTFWGVRGRGEQVREESTDEQKKAERSVVSILKMPGATVGRGTESIELLQKKLSRERAFANLKVLFEMTKLFKGVFEPREVLERSMNKVVEIMNADEACLFLYNEETDKFDLAISKTQDQTSTGGAHRYSRTILERTIKNREGVLCRDTSLDGRFEGAESIVQKHILSSMCVPLWNNEQPIGAIYLHNTEAKHAFSEEDLYFLSILAQHVSDVMENLSLYEQIRQKERLETELRVANQIQQQLLLKEFPRDARIEFAALNLPAREVGGDLYDVIQLAPGRFLLVIGDVAGKGMPAALYMASIRSIIRSQSLGDCQIENIVKNANALIEADSKDGTFITMFCALMDVGERKLRFVNAGHNPPLLCAATTGEIRELKTSGKPLGVLPNTDYLSSMIELHHGDMLVCFTDGITEARNPEGEMFGQERLEAAVKSGVGGSAGDLADRIIAEVTAFVEGEEQSDDLTLLAAKISGPKPASDTSTRSN